ncbi:DUF1566 domain-containing protein, partial [Candidatus Gracilibacteria bacterium]|nr:DUF1566 domain-containing protein [Candidatus Gracilibacteria bacterium]
ELPATAVQGTGDKDWACTRDNVTGLIWEVKTTSGLHKSTDTFTWFKNGEGISNGGSCQTSGRCDMEKFTEDVNQEGLCGRKDWRVPEIEELESIVDYGVRLNTLDPAYFPYTADGDSFWSNNPSPAHHPAQYAYYIFAADGAVTLGYLGKYETLRNVRLVSGTKTPSNYVDNGDSTVTDTTLGLMWKKDYEMNIPGEPAADLTNLDAFTWSDALKRAAADRTGGYSDWRLPNIKELRSLVDETRFSVAIDPAFNKVFTQTHFWSSTPVQDFFFRSNQSWTVQFDDGTPQHLQLRSAKQHVRLVRDVK